MTIELNIPEEQSLKPKIMIFGCGGAGGNAVGNMINAGVSGVKFVVANTDAQALEESVCENRIQLGASITKGLGAGSYPEVGRASAEESEAIIADYLEGNNMVFITGGLGGGTGTGAAPVVARIAKELGILTIGVVTKPFHFEGGHRMKVAEAGLLELEKQVDTLIVIPNQNLFRIADKNTTFVDAFKLADTVLNQGVRGVTDLMVMPGLINLDFSDVRTVMSEMGKAMMGTGEGEGDNRAIEAAEAAIENPLLDNVSMKGARGVLINITGGDDMTLFEVDEAANRIREEVEGDANIIFGSSYDPNLSGRLKVSVVATGIEGSTKRETSQNDTNQQSAPVQKVAEARVEEGAFVAPAAATITTAPQLVEETQQSAVAQEVEVVAESAAPASPAAQVPEAAQPATQESQKPIISSDNYQAETQLENPAKEEKKLAGNGLFAGLFGGGKGEKKEVSEGESASEKKAGGDDDFDIPAFLRRK